MLLLHNDVANSVFVPKASHAVGDVGGRTGEYTRRLEKFFVAEVRQEAPGDGQVRDAGAVSGNCGDRQVQLEFVEAVAGCVAYERDSFSERVRVLRRRSSTGEADDLRLLRSAGL